MPHAIHLPQDVLDKQESADNLLDELAWWHDNGQLRYKSDEDARLRRSDRDRRSDGPDDEPDDDTDAIRLAD